MIGIFILQKFVQIILFRLLSRLTGDISDSEVRSSCINEQSSGVDIASVMQSRIPVVVDLIHIHILTQNPVQYIKLTIR